MHDEDVWPDRIPLQGCTGCVQGLTCCAVKMCCHRCATIKAGTAAKNRDTTSSILRSSHTLRTTAIYMKCPLLEALCLARLCPCPLHWQDQGWHGCKASCQCRDISTLHSRVKVGSNKTQAYQGLCGVVMIRRCICHQVAFKTSDLPLHNILGLHPAG